MYEVQKIAITVIVLCLLPFILTKVVAVSAVAIAVALFYHFDFECYPPRRRVGDKVINFGLKVRNSKIGDFFRRPTDSGVEMHSSGGAGLGGALWSKGASPDKSSFGGGIEPRGTSTPPPRLQRREPLFTPRPTARGYSLSERGAANASADIERSRGSPVQNTSGPLLASTRFHNSVRTYMDSKSPGLSSRIVQYNRSTEHRPTHQAKYNRPGIFPVVHLFNREKAALRKPKTVTMRLAPSDTLPQYSPDHSKLLLNGALKDPVTNTSSSPSVVQSMATPPENDTSTRSVLDALKEISRKRIHAHEDLEDNPDSSKKQKKDSSTEQSQKRAREDSPIGDAGSSVAAKRSCPYIDPIYASTTSSNMFREQLDKGLKRKDNFENNVKDKIIKTAHLDEETQTRSEERAKSTQEVAAVENWTATDDIIQTKSTETEDDDEEDWVQVFDDRPLAYAKKKKLALLLGALTSKAPYIKPPDGIETFEEKRKREMEEKKELEKKEEEKKLVSILSPPNKAKHDKHVTFNIPQQDTVVSCNDISTAGTITNIAKNEDQIAPVLTMTKTQSSSSVFITSGSNTAAVVSLPSVITLPQSKSIPAYSVAPTSSTSVLDKTLVTTSPATTAELTTITSAPVLSVLPTPISSVLSTPISTLASVSTTVVAPVNPVTTTPPKIGGFKFDFTTPSQASSVPAVNTFNAAVTSSSVVSSVLLPASTSTFSFSPPKRDEKPVKTSEANFKLPTTSAFSFTPAHSTSNQPLSVVSFAPKTTAQIAPFVTSTVSSPFSLSNTVAPVVPNPSPFPGGFNFKTPNTTGQIVVSTTAASVTSTAPSTQSFSFGNSNSKNLFSSASVTPFGNNTTTATFSFNSAPVPSFGATAKTTSMFASVTSTPSFGQTAAPSFGAKTVASSLIPAFGHTKTTSTTSIFPIATSTITTSNMFGSSTPTFTPPTTFGSTTSSQAVFGTPVTSSATHSFGGASAPIFGASTTSIPTFGSTFTATTSASAFGSATSTTPTFGSSISSPFASTTTVGPSIFSSSTPAATAETNKQQTNVFSGTAGPSFGSNQSFGGFGNTAAGGFGSSTSSPFSAPTGFGTPKQETPKVFGTSAPGFGAPSDKTSGFGAGAAFGGFNSKPQVTTPAFGANAGPPTNAFGGSNAPFGASGSNQPTLNFTSNTAQSSSGFSFGAAASNTKPAAFNFGGNTEPPKPGGFSFGATAAPTFGTNAPATFGSSAPSGGFAPQFNAPAAGTFSIGSGSNRPRTTLRAKRRT